MIKKIAIIIFSTILFLFLYADIIIAEEICGIADTPYNQCCNSKENFPVVTSPVGEKFNGIIENLQGAIEEGTEKIIGKEFYQLIKGKCFLGEPVEVEGKCICKQSVTPTPVYAFNKICQDIFAKDVEQLKKCNVCIMGGGYYSALGCIPTNLSNFINDFVLKRAIGLSGIISFICIIYAAFLFQTSSGNPEKIKKGQELLTSCITGLLIIIFSVLILKIIGIDILKLPGMSQK